MLDQVVRVSTPHWHSTGLSVLLASSRWSLKRRARGGGAGLERFDFNGSNMLNSAVRITSSPILSFLITYVLLKCPSGRDFLATSTPYEQIFEPLQRHSRKHGVVQSV